MSLSNHADSLEQELVGCFFRNMDTQAWLQLVQFFLNLENHI